MANDLNHCTFIGRLGADPEIRYLPSGDPVANLRIAVGESWKDKQTGQKQERTEWITCVMFGKLAEMVGSYWQKGTQVFVAGKFRTRKWADQSGQDRYSSEIVVNQVQTLKDGVQSGQQGGQAPQQRQAPQPQRAPQSPPPDMDPFDDPIPF